MLCRFTNYNRHDTLVVGVDNGEALNEAGAGDKRENSELSPQFHCEFKSALKIKVINKHVYRYMWCSCLYVCSVCVGGGGGGGNSS